MNTAVSTNRSEPDSVAPKALGAAAVFWFLVALIGQWMFVLHIVPWGTI
jgi:hypothetical protein